MQTVFTADKIFTGTDWLSDHAIVIENEVIIHILPIVSLTENYVVTKHAPIIAPAFVDVQIYGAKERLFSTYPDTESLHTLYERCKASGTHNFLPTLATNEYDVFYKSIAAIKKYWQEGGEGVLGLHIEGPWINKIKRGAHIESFIHSPSIQQAKKLLEYGKDVIKMITLAPEVCSKEVLDLIKSNDIIISAGHSNATFAEANAGFDNGITAVTHLFNAMSPLHHRETGLPGAAMQQEYVVSSIIPDGYHVSFEAISIAKKIMNERLFIITDAVTETKEGLYPHHLNGEKYESEGTLSGSALTMLKGVKNLIDHCGIELSEALRMASYYPAKLLSLNDELGKIKQGFKAEIIMLDEQLELVTF